MTFPFRFHLKKHWPGVPRWIANWGWAGLVGFALAFESASEYLICLILFAAAWVSLFAAVHRWAGVEDSPALTKQLRMTGKLLACALLLLSFLWVSVRKDDHPWSSLSFSSRKTLPADTLVPKPFVPKPENWDVKTNSKSTTADVHRKRELPIPAPRPPLQRTEEFLTNVMLYNDESKIFCTGTMGSQIRMTSCGEMANVFKGALEDQDLRTSLGVTLQHYLVSILNFAGREWGSHGESTDAIYQDFLPPVDPPDVKTYAVHKIMDIPETEIHMFPDMLRFEWDLARMRLPEGTTISFLTLPSENQGPIAYGVRLERKGFYRIDPTFTFRQQFAPGQTPKEYDIGKVGYDGQLKTLTFLVRTEWEIQRSNDASFVVEDYDIWATKLAKRIHESLIN